MAKTKLSEGKDKISRSDIINWICSIKSKAFGKDLTTKIVNDYLEIVFQTLINGYEWDLPGNLGTLCIFKNELSRDQLPNRSRAESYMNKQRIIAYNPNKIGSYYTIELSSSYLTESGMEFKACKKLRKLLFDAVYNENKEYRSK